MIKAGATSTEEVVSAPCCCARPTGGSHGRTTRGPAQRGEGAKRRPRPTGRKGAAKDTRPVPESPGLVS